MVEPRTVFDLYVAENMDIDKVKPIVEKLLGLELEGRSSDWVGEYSKTSHDFDWNVKLQRNIEYDGPEMYAYEARYTMQDALLYINNCTAELA